MKKIIIIILALILVTFGGVVLNKSIAKTKNGKPINIVSSLTGQYHKATLEIEGMWCAGCATGAEYNLKAVEGVADAYVGFTDDLDGEGWVVYDKKKVTQSQIIEAVEPYKAVIVNDIVYKGE